VSGPETGGRDAKRRLPSWFIRTERIVKALVALLLLALALCQFMPFSPALRSAFSETERLEGQPYRP